MTSKKILSASKEMSNYEFNYIEIIKFDGIENIENE